MSKQPEALRLADDLQSAVQTYPQTSEYEPGGYCRQEDQLMDDAAAELRRLHAINAELVEALKACDEAMSYMSEYDIPLTLPSQVKDALAKAEGREA